MRHAIAYEPTLARIPKRKQRLPLLPLLLGLVVVLVLVNGAVLFTRDPQASVATHPRAGAEPVEPAETTTHGQNQQAGKNSQQASLGVFVGTDAKAAAAFERWLGAPIQDVVDFSNRDTWADISNPAYLLANWQHTKYRLIYGVPMLPNNLRAMKEVAMRKGASGAYDTYFRQLATRLVAGGHEDAVLRIGWEFNLTTWAWGIKDHTVFVNYFRHVVKAMRSVPGQKFNINWNPNNGFNPYDAYNYWPGNAYVDSVGVDAYDVDRNRYPYPANCSATCRETRQQTAWDQVVFGGPRGLSYWAYFAQQHRKEFSLPEWSMWARYDGTGGGDDPFFLSQMHTFMESAGSNVAFAAYFNRNSKDGKHNLLENFPAGAKRFRELFGQWGAADRSVDGDGGALAAADPIGPSALLGCGVGRGEEEEVAVSADQAAECQ